MMSLYETMQKSARARWQKEERAGNLGDAERSRIGYTQPEQGNAASARGRVAAGRELHNLQEQVFDKDPIRAARSGMQSYAPEIGHETTTSRVLQPGDAVERHQRLNKLQVEQFAKHGPMVNKNLGAMGPANLAGMIFMGDDGANFIHEHLGTPSHLRDPASNASVMKSIMDHERAEGVQLWSQATGKLPSTSQASHAGLLPILAERMSTRDPQAQGLFEFMRRRGGEDKKVNDMLRNSGAVGNWVPPMGGRVHRTIEQKIRDTIHPDATPMAMQRRMFPWGTPDARTYLSELSSLPQEGLWQRLSRRTRGVVNPRRLWGTAALAATIAPMVLMSYNRRAAKQKAIAAGLALPESEEQKVANALLGAAFAGMTPASTVMNEVYRRRAVEEGRADPDNPYAKANLYGTLGASALGLGAGYALTGVRKGNIIPATMSSLASTLTNAYLGGKMDGHDMGWRNARFRGDVRRAVETPEAHVQAPTGSTMSALYASEAPWMRDVTTRIAKREKPLALDHYVLKRDLDPETYAKVREVFK